MMLHYLTAILALQVNPWFNGVVVRTNPWLTSNRAVVGLSKHPPPPYHGIVVPTKNQSFFLIPE